MENKKATMKLTKGRTDIKKIFKITDKLFLLLMKLTKRLNFSKIFPSLVTMKYKKRENQTMKKPPK